MGPSQKEVAFALLGFRATGLAMPREPAALRRDAGGGGGVGEEFRAQRPAEEGRAPDSPPTRQDKSHAFAHPHCLPHGGLGFPSSSSSSLPGAAADA